MNTIAPAVEIYFDKLPTNQRHALETIRQTVKDMLPEWHEEIKTNIPAIRYKGKTVVGLGAFNKHVGLYVMFGNALQILASDLADFDTGNKVIRFSPDTPLPEELVKAITRIRIREIEAATAR